MMHMISPMNKLSHYFADLHIHIGSALDSAVKITASRRLTVKAILRKAAEDKGLDIIGIIDCLSPPVRKEIAQLKRKNILKPLDKGGYITEAGTLLIPGAEIESREENGKKAHYLAYFPDLKLLEKLAGELETKITNLTLSSQTCYLPGAEILNLVQKYRGILIPAHIFTPHCSFYGFACSAFREIFSREEWEQIPAVELGLSADRYLAGLLSELDDKALLSNSDAHSLPKLAREYNLLALAGKNFSALKTALYGKRGGVISNFGLHPGLGKYHRSYCSRCEEKFTPSKSVLKCPRCGSKNITVGVKDRILQIADRDMYIDEFNSARDSNYIHQVPLLDIPGLGPATLEKLLKNIGTEMEILHDSTREELVGAAGEDIAEKILASRRGELEIIPGGGGEYGRVKGH